MKFSRWNIICFGQKTFKVQFFRLECSNESSPNSSCHFWNYKVRVYSNSASLFSIMKDNSSVFCSSNLVYFGQKEPIEKKFSDFWVVRWKLTKFLMSYFKLQVSFSLNFVSLFSVMGDNSSVLFGWNFIWFGWWKISDFQLLTWNFTKFVLWYAPCVEST